MFAAEFWRPGFSFTRGRRLFLQTIIVLFSRKCILHITRPQGGRSWQFWPKKALFLPKVFQKPTSATLFNLLQHFAHWQKPGSTINFCRPNFSLSRYVHYWGELKGPETINIALNGIFVRKKSCCWQRSDLSLPEEQCCFPKKTLFCPQSSKKCVNRDKS